ncbi:PBS lyase HEAT-like repeat [Beggiatoa sp. PS]|nr:PBS lyase HEAT-like repeat [Beggiatoa sp. PS]
MEPYKGLRPYEESDKDNFFGREAETRILIDKILTHKLTFLFAASGVGKSSLLQAAILPELKRPSRQNRESLDVIYYKEWVGNPLITLQNAILDDLKAKQLLTADYQLDASLSLTEFFHLCTTFTSEPLIIILDQFEEFFNYQRFGDYFTPVIGQLAEAIHDRDTGTTFVISMREDFALELNAFKEAMPTFLIDNFYRLEKLTLDKARDAIVTPVENVGFHYEDELLAELLTDLSLREQIDRYGLETALKGKFPTLIEPPHLQMICSQLWAAEQHNPKRCLTKAVYDRKGKTNGLLKTYFEKRIEQFASSEKQLASAAFDYLVNKHGTKMAYPLPDLARQLRVDRTPLSATLDKLDKYRILRRYMRYSTKEHEGILWYELHHDIFSKPIYDWNERYKNRQRLKKMAWSAVSIGLGTLTLFAGYQWWLNTTHYHFRLSLKAGISDTIEVYQGKKGSFDIFRRQKYLYETVYSRDELEADKLFQEKHIEDIDKQHHELISELPIGERLEAHWQNGNLDDILCLANGFVSPHNLDFSEQIIEALAGFRSIKTVEKLGELLQAEKDVQLKLKMIAALGTSQSPRVVSWLLPFLENENVEIRNSTVLSLTQLGTHQAIAPTIALLKHAKADIRRSAAELLGNLEPIEAIQPLIESLNDSEPSVRKSVVEALSNFSGHPEITPPLIALKKDPKASVRQSVAEVLGYLGDTKAVMPLIELLQDKNADVRNSAVTTLGNLGTPQAIKPLAELLHDQNDEVRNNTIIILASWGHIESLNFLIKEGREIFEEIYSYYVQDEDYQGISTEFLESLDSVEFIKGLIKLLNAQDAEIRRKAAESLGQLNSHLVVKPLIELLDDPSDKVRQSAVKAVVQLDEITGFDSLRKLLRDPNDEVRQRVATALGKIGNTKAVQALIELLNDPNTEVRLNAIQSLEEIDHIDAVNPLIRLLKDQNAKVRDNATQALGQLGHADAVNPLIGLLKDQNLAVRSSAAESLGQLGNTLAITPLIELLTKQSPPKQRSHFNSYSAWFLESSIIIQALGQLGSQEAIQPLIQLLKSKNWEERRNAAFALGLISNVEAIQPFIELLSDEKWEIRVSAAWALGKLGRYEAIFPLMESLNDSKSDVRLEATLALKQFSNVQVIKPLISVFDNMLEMGHYGIEPLERLYSVEFVEPLIGNLNIYDLSSALTLVQLGSSEVIKPFTALFNKAQREWLLREDESTYLMEAGNVLIQLGNTQVIKRLIKFLSKSFNPITNAHEYTNMMEKIGASGNINAIAPLIELLQHPEPQIRSSTAEALGMLDHNGKAVKPLMALLSDRNSKVRSSAADTLGSLGNEQSVKPLIALLNDHNSLVRSNAAMALGRLDNTEALNPLMELLKDSISSVRSSAATALGDLGNKIAVKPLIDLLNDPVSSVRQSAILALGELSQPEAKQPLFELLNNPILSVRDKAIEALALINLSNADEEIKSTVVTLLNAKSSQLRDKVIKSEKLPSNESELIILLKEETSKVKLETIKSLGNSSIDTMLFLTLLEDNDAEVRLAAMRHLLDQVRTYDTEYRIAAMRNTLDDISYPYFESSDKHRLSEKLQKIILNQQEYLTTRILAIKVLGKFGIEGTADSIINVVKQETENQYKELFVLEVYRALGYIASTQALPFLQDQLIQLEKDKRVWRKQRDKINNQRDELELEACVRQEFSQKRQERWAYLQSETELGYALTKIAPQTEGIKMLAHNLFEVRKGAWLAIGQMKSIELLKRINQQREQSHQAYFHHAAFRAIDKSLITIEVFGKDADLAALNNWLPDINDHAVRDRVKFTVAELEYRLSTAKE